MNWLYEFARLLVDIVMYPFVNTPFKEEIKQNALALLLVFCSFIAIGYVVLNINHSQKNNQIYIINK
jgi:hypothetical protein